MAAAEAKLPQPTGSSVSLPSQKDEEELELPPTPVSRLQMLEYVNLREWWSHAQGALFFTCFLWVWFIVLMYMRADVEGLFRVRSALAQHVQRVVAHPSLSRAPLHTPAEAPLQCRCACRTRGSSFPTSPCDKVGTEVLDFTGTLRADLAARLLQSHQGMLGTGADVPPKTWDGILSAEDAWFWVLHGLLPDVWGLRNGLPVERPGLLVHRNLVVGGIRARQMRAKPAESCKVDPDLLSLYPARCRSFDPETEPFGPAAAGSVDHSGGAFAPASEASEGGAVEDGTYYAMFDVEQPLSNALETANFLRQNNWLDEATRSLELQALLLNAEAGAYAILSVKFIFPFHGGVEKYIGVRTFHAVQSEEVFTFEAYYPELVWLALIVWLFLQELLQIGLSIYRGRIREYFTNIWNLVDWFSIALGAAICYFYWVMLSDTARIAYTIVGLPRAPLDDVDIARYRQSWAGVLDTARDVSELKGYYSICLFWYTTVISLRFLKCCTGQAKLAMIQTSLGHAFLDVLHFSIIFLVLFANFVLGGRVLFGAP